MNNKYIYTMNLFVNSEISKILLDKIENKNKKFNILEIGCFVGLSAIFF